LHALKTMLVIALGLGSVWAAWEIAPAATSGMLTSVAYAQSAEEPRAVQPGATKEMDEQLARINATLASDGEIREFEPTEPLPADQAIDMSSEL
jgi:hypothetical protein